MNADSGKSRFLPLPFYKTNRPRAARESRFTIRTHSASSWIRALQNEPAFWFAAVVMGPPMNADSTKSQFHPLPFYKTNPFRSGSGKPLYNTNPFRQFVDSRFTKRTRGRVCGCGYGAADEH